jgi:ectoine hydroxylase-related dioxygenase (phytanoyl-CoA dioxygenase family)
VHEGQEPQFPHEQFIPCPVKKGACVLIDGLVLHKSEHNRSDKSRHIYTFHIYDAGVAKWDERNWIQPTDKGTFAPFFAPGEKR